MFILAICIETILSDVIEPYKSKITLVIVEHFNIFGAQLTIYNITI